MWQGKNREVKNFDLQVLQYFFILAHNDFITGNLPTVQFIKSKIGKSRITTI